MTDNNDTPTDEVADGNEDEQEASNTNTNTNTETPVDPPTETAVGESEDDGADEYKFEFDDSVEDIPHPDTAAEAGDDDGEQSGHDEGAAAEAQAVVNDDTGPSAVLGSDNETGDDDETATVGLDGGTQTDGDVAAGDETGSDAVEPVSSVDAGGLSDHMANQGSFGQESDQALLLEFWKAVIKEEEDLILDPLREKTAEQLEQSETELDVNNTGRLAVPIDLDEISHILDREEFADVDPTVNPQKHENSAVDVLEAAIERLPDDDPLKEAGYDSDTDIIPRFASGKPVTIDGIHPNMKGDSQRAELLTVEGRLKKATESGGDRGYKRSHIAWQCQRCGTLHRMDVDGTGDTSEPYECEGCERNGPFEENDQESESIAHQRLIVQEPPEDVGGGTQASKIEVVVLGDDLVDRATPGGDVTVTGRVEPLDTGSGSSTHGVCLHATWIEPHDDDSLNPELSEEDREELKEWFETHLKERSPEEILTMVQESILPQIYGMELVKRGIGLMLFNGVGGTVGGKNIRGNIHVLLAGDPSTGKSDLLSWAYSLMPRANFMTGDGSSQAGLTASAVADDMDGQWTIEPGTLPLSDRSVACIDEFDNLSDEETNLEYTLSHGKVEISKAGMTSTLNARCNVFAACNPDGDVLDDDTPPAEQIDMQQALYSRFDLVFPIKDDHDEAKDRGTARSVTGSHQAAARKKQANTTIDSELYEHVQTMDDHDAEVTLDVEPDPAVPTDILRKWILFARQIHPALSDEVRSIVADWYVDERAGNEVVVAGSLSARKIGSVVRLSQALARMCLCEVVTTEHLHMARDLVKTTIGQTCHVPEEGKIDWGMAEMGRRTQDTEEQTSQGPLNGKHEDRPGEIPTTADESAEVTEGDIKDAIKSKLANEKEGMTRPQLKGAVMNSLSGDAEPDRIDHYIDELETNGDIYRNGEREEDPYRST